MALKIKHSLNPNQLPLKVVPPAGKAYVLIPSDTSTVSVPGGAMIAPAEEILKAQLKKERAFLPEDFSLFAKLKWPLELVDRSRIRRVSNDEAEVIFQIK